MDFLRTALNPWGQDIWLGVALDLVWLAAAAGLVFIVGHTIWYRGFTKKHPDDGHGAAQTQAAAGVPDKVERHTGASRAFHWIMAAAMFVLLITAFFPMVGIQFDWVPLHWQFGLVLTVAILWHVVHATFFQGLRTMYSPAEDTKEALETTKYLLAGGPEPDSKPGKYPADHKMYHHAASITTIAAIVTGVLMMLRVDTWLGAANPYFLSDGVWGWVYVIHGLAGVGLITLTITHVYFAIRPDKWWITRSMIKGWITREEYLDHFDPERWNVGAPSSSTAGGGGGVGEQPVPQPVTYREESDETS